MNTSALGEPSGADELIGSGQREKIAREVVRATLWVVLITTFVGLLVFASVDPAPGVGLTARKYRIAFSSLLPITAAIGLWLLSRGHMVAAVWLSALTFYVLPMGSAIGIGLGVYAAGITLWPVVVLLLGFALGRASAVLAAVVALATIATLLLAQRHGLLPGPTMATIGVPETFAMMFALALILNCWLTVRYAELFKGALNAATEAKLALAESRAHLSAVIDAEPECVKILGLDGTLMQMNRAGLELIEADSFEQVAGQCIDSLVMPAYREAFAALTHRVCQGESGMLEFEIYGLKGRRLWLESHAVPWRNTLGAITGVLAVTRDISERRRTEQALRTSEEMLRWLYEMSPLGIVLTDMRGKFIEANEAFMLIAGCSEDHVRGLDYCALTPNRYEARETRQMNALELTGRYGPYEKEYIRGDGSPVPLRLNGVTVTGRNGERYIWSIVEDVTESRRIENEIRKLNSELEQRVLRRTSELEVANANLIQARDAAFAASRAKSSFIANMSHEIRTPMNGILGMALLMRRKGVTADQTLYLDKIDVSAKHLLHIIDDILDISKIEANKVVLEERAVDLDWLLSSAVSMVSARAVAKGLKLVAEAVPSMPSVLGDPTRLLQAWVNFAANAIKFTDTGTVTLRAVIHADDAGSVLMRFEVQDTGVGIDPDVLPRLFTAFEQADSSTTRKHGGTGLGLAITRRLAELMGGRAGAHSTLGVGSTFWFTARLNKGVGARPEVRLASTDQLLHLLRCKHDHNRILLVDDEPVSREVAQGLLELAGLQVDLAGNGLEALERLAAHPYDLILMDMQMPAMDGLEATRQMRQLPAGADVPILGQTANAFAEDRARCLEAGMDDVITKPLDIAQLYDALLRGLQRPRGVA